MTTPVKLTFVHGWGFDKNFWNALCALLPDHEYRLIDLGFFGAPPDDLESAPEQSILIGHSLGFVHALKRRQDWRGWIAINGFPRFIGNGSKSGCVPSIALHEMRRRLQNDPAKILADFHRLIGTTAPTGAPDLKNLSGGLDELRETDIGEILPRLDMPSLILASRHDPLVPAAISEELYALAKNSHIQWRATGGHALAQSDAAWCAAHITEFLTCHFL